jgi:hypothetical protein
MESACYKAIEKNPPSSKYGVFINYSNLTLYLSYILQISPSYNIVMYNWTYFQMSLGPLQ